MGIESIDLAKCNHCGICYDICPLDVIQQAGGLTYIAYPEDCMSCYLCELECPKEAIYVSPERAQPVVLPY